MTSAFGAPFSPIMQPPFAFLLVGWTSVSNRSRSRSRRTTWGGPFAAACSALRDKGPIAPLTAEHRDVLQACSASTGHSNAINGILRRWDSPGIQHM
jgi:hypothetical protein